ncbi:MAG: glycoside hydrolase family 76 protein [Actinomycetota bacterium]|nr:glycoside hydrolase family 76 protein [Actinomycetota bacterium]
MIDSVSEAWTALERTAIRRSRRGLVVAEDRGDRKACSLWSLVHVLWAACDLADLGRTTPLDELTAIIERYRRGSAYAATPRGRRYYDDNAWLGLVSLALARSTRKPIHAERARELIRFVREGEDPAGGVRWVEGSSTRNACSTASAAWLSLVAGSDENDRAFAERAIDWLLGSLRSSDGSIADRIDQGVVVPTVWSYNQGAAVAAMRLLGRNEDADATVRRSIEIFTGERLWKEPPPFLAIWFRVLLDDPSVGDIALRSLDEHVERMTEHAYDAETGLFTEGGIGSYDGRTTIDQAAAIQLLSMREARR